MIQKQEILIQKNIYQFCMDNLTESYSSDLLSKVNSTKNFYLIIIPNDKIQDWQSRSAGERLLTVFFEVLQLHKERSIGQNCNSKNISVTFYYYFISFDVVYGVTRKFDLQKLISSYTPCIMWVPFWQS